MVQTRRETPNSTLQEVIGLTLLVVGVLLLLALISYSPGDVPAWMRSARVEKSAHSTHNYVGSLGAIMAFLSYATLGAASYLLAASLIGYGAVACIGRQMGFAMRPLWTAGFVVSGACLVHVLGWTVIDRAKLGLGSEGGFIGEYVGGKIFANVFGPAAILVLLLIYVVCIILMTGLRPVAVARQLIAMPRAWLDARRKRYRERAGEEQRLALEQRKMERERKRMERDIGRRSDEDSAAAKLEQTELLPLDQKKETAPESEPDRPEPKIFDAAAPMPPTAKKEKKKEKIELLQTISSENYRLPDFDLLDAVDHSTRVVTSPDELRSVQNQIIETLAEFGIAVTAGDITKGPTITRYEVYPARGVRVDKIATYERDIARATMAERINILAPIPGKDTVGIEIANSRKQMVTLRELLESDDFQSSKAKIPLALGKDVYGKSIIADLAAMPHGLVAGTTGSGKSVCINSIIASILFKFKPKELRLIMIDPKVVEMQMYNTLPHLVVPVVTDPKKVLLALKWAVNEMEKRYAIFAKVGVRNMASFNTRPKPKSQRELDEIAQAKAAADPRTQPRAVIDPNAEPETASSSDILGKTFGEEPPREEPVMNGDSEQYGTPDSDRETVGEELNRAEQAELGITVARDDGIVVPETMEYIVIIVDELADLMQTAPADVELLIARITQKARAAGIHMLIATQTPRADVITGVIKANVPCRIAFQVASPLDSRVILDENGAERLLGMGDLLYRPPGTSKLLRAQGVLVTDEEVHRIVDFVSKQGEQCFESEIHQKLESVGSGDDEEEVSDEDEELVQKCIEVMQQEGKASTSLFQRRLRLGYTRAARILDILEDRGYVGPGDGAKPREILRQPDV
jgi:S-DNA-T family DNA segregation ATPase FtsK/SpoIIIE